MKDSLEDKIESTRAAMVYAAIKEGLSAAETIELSRKLDGLLNEFDMFKSRDQFQNDGTSY